GAHDEVPAPPRRARTRPGRGPQPSEGQLLPPRGRALVPRQPRRDRARAPVGPVSAIRRVPGPARRVEPRAGVPARTLVKTRPVPPCRAHARDLAFDLPAACAAGSGMNYAVVTPVRNEEENLPRLADALARQTHLPQSWLIVDNGSEDGTLGLATELAEAFPWIRVLRVDGDARASRGAPVVRSIHAAVAEVGHTLPDLVVNVDADVSFEPDFFERLVQAVVADPALGIARGSGWEFRRGRWRQRHLTGSTVWGATRAYRCECLRVVLPLEERVGWDGVDELKANAAGWKTRILLELPFYHHRHE